MRCPGSTFWYSYMAEMLMQFHAKIDTKIVPPDLHKHSSDCATLSTPGLFEALQLRRKQLYMMPRKLAIQFSSEVSC